MIFFQEFGTPIKIMKLKQVQQTYIVLVIHLAQFLKITSLANSRLLEFGPQI